VVVFEGPSAGGGVPSSTVDPGVPLGPGLGATFFGDCGFIGREPEGSEGPLQNRMVKTGTLVAVVVAIMVGVDDLGQ
jgi:hypothetical protein